MTHHDASSDPIPHIVTADLPFSTPDELRDRWRALMGPLGFSETLLWSVFVDDERFVRSTLIQFPLEGAPDPDLTDLLMHRWADVIERTGVAGVAMLLSRPGSDGISPWDRGWVRLLTTAAQKAGVTIEPIFRANSRDVVVVPDSRTGRRSVA